MINIMARLTITAGVVLASAGGASAADGGLTRKDAATVEGWSKDLKAPTTPAAKTAGPSSKVRFAPPPLKFDDAGVSRWAAEYADLPDWVRVDYSEEVVVFVQKERPKLGAWPRVRSQVRYESFAEMDGAPYPSERIEVEIDCDHDRIQYLNWEAFNEPGLKGGVALRPEIETGWRYPHPFTMDRAVVVHVCDWAASLRGAA